LLEEIGRKYVAGGGLDRRQHLRVGDPFGAQAEHEARQTRGAVLGRFGHGRAANFGGTPPRTAFRSRTVGSCVRSMCSGVTEILPARMAAMSVPSATCGRRAVKPIQ